MRTQISRKSNKLQYEVSGEFTTELISTFGKYMTSILNDGEGGVIILSIEHIRETLQQGRRPKMTYIKQILQLKEPRTTMHSNQDVFVTMRDVLLQEIRLIKPMVRETEYRILLEKKETFIGTVKVEIHVEPVPWGLEAYAAPDGHVYTPDLEQQSQGDDGYIYEIGDVFPNIHAQKTKKNATSDVCDMEKGDSCKPSELKQNTNGQGIGSLHSGIKDIIDDCVTDLRDIKAKLGIKDRCDRTDQKNTENVKVKAYNPQERRAVVHLQKCTHCYTQNKHIQHSRSNSIPDTSAYKTFREDFDFTLCRDSKGRSLLQVDGEIPDDDDGNGETNYALPQLDGMHDQNMVKEESNTSSEAYKLQEFSDLQKHKPSIVIFWLGLVLVALIQYGREQIVVPIPNSVERVSYTEPSPSLNRTITYNVNQQQRIGLANTVTGKSWGPFASVDFVYLNTNFYDQERIESEEILHNANKVNKNDKERDETEERVYKRIDSNNRMGIYDGFTFTIVKVPLLGLIQFGRGQTVLLIAKSESAIPTSMSITTILENTDIPYHSDMSLENVQSFVAENLNCSTMPICETTMRTNQHDVPDLSSTQDVISAAHMTKLIFPNGLFNRDIANVLTITLDGEGHIFLASSPYIYRVNINGTGLITWIGDVYRSYGLIVDKVNRYLIWSDWGTNTIERAPLDKPSSREIILSSTAVTSGLYHDKHTKRMFWCVQGASGSMLLSANTDGTDKQIIAEITQPYLYMHLNTAFDHHFYVTGFRHVWITNLEKVHEYFVYDIHAGVYTEMFVSRTLRPNNVAIINASILDNVCELHCNNGGSPIHNNGTCDCVYPWTGRVCNAINEVLQQDDISMINTDIKI